MENESAVKPVALYIYSNIINNNINNIIKQKQMHLPFDAEITSNHLHIVKTHCTFRQKFA